MLIPFGSGHLAARVSSHLATELQKAHSQLAVRPVGLRGPAPENVLFNYVIHEKIEKSENFNLERIMRITVQRI